MKTHWWLLAVLTAVGLTGFARAQETAVVDKENVLVRGQATRFSETVTRLDKGAVVKVLEEITIENPKPDDVAKWARIALPEESTVWVHSLFIDADTKTVTGTKLNMRGGPGENYSVLGQLEKGATVKEVSTKGDWIEIEAPESAYAFVAANLISKQATPTPAPAEPALTTPPVAETTPPPAQPTETTPVEPAPVAPAPEPSAPIAATPERAVPPSVPTPELIPTPDQAQPPIVSPVPELSVPRPTLTNEPPPKRIVQREGVVEGTVSIQAPSHYRLVSPVTGETINYLHSTSTNLVLRKYRGLRIIVTGEEGLDKRWPNTPVITIQKIQVVE